VCLECQESIASLGRKATTSWTNNHAKDVNRDVSNRSLVFHNLELISVMECQESGVRGICGRGGTLEMRLQMPKAWQVAFSRVGRDELQLSQLSSIASYTTGLDKDEFIQRTCTAGVCRRYDASLRDTATLGPPLTRRR
jgi:hypothetical protein